VQAVSISKLDLTVW